jgi:Glycosyltransferase
MNILFVSTEYPRRGQPTTGLPNYLYRVSLSLIKLGHNPAILAAGEWDSYRVEQNIPIWIVGVPTYYNCKSQVFNYISSALKVGYALNHKIKELVKKRNIEIIQFTSLYGIALLYSQKVPTVLRLSSYAKISFATFQTYSESVVNIMSLFERMSSRRCNTVFAPCKNTATVFEQDCHRSIKVIETPFVNDVQQYDNQIYVQNLIGKKYVLFFGTLYAEKGILVIAEILEQFLEMNQDYYFVFIGNTSNINGKNVISILCKEAGKHVNRLLLFHALPHNQLYPIIQKADLVVLPSLMENLSNACIEAMYFERVVVGTNGASFEQLITHGKNGLLCQIGDAQDLLEKMQMAVSMSASRKQEMGKLARKRIDKLNPEYVVRKLVRLYEYVILNCKHR